MNLTESGWYGQVKRDSKTINMEGTLGEVLLKISQYCAQTEYRAKPDGPRRIELFLQDSPITEESIRKAKLLSEVEAGLIESTDNAYDIKPGESWESYIERLIDEENCPRTFAVNQANMMFGKPKDETASRFHADPLAQTYVKLTASLEAFTNASPGDYVTAKEHVRINYPEYFANITPRI